MEFGMLKLLKYIWALFLEMEDAALFTDDFVNGETWKWKSKDEDKT